MRITYIPTLSEHLRARRALGAVLPVFDRYALLPWFLAVGLIGSMIQQVANPAASPWQALVTMFGGTACFFAGIGIRARKHAGKPLTVELGDEGIELRQPSNRWSVPWAGVRRVDETAEFFLVAAERAAFYLPKRALCGAEGEAALREMLRARRE